LESGVIVCLTFAREVVRVENSSARW
jgi:hypothetical protein